MLCQKTFLFLTNSSKFVEIDEEDYQRLNKYTWCLCKSPNSVNIMAYINGKTQSLSRFVLNYTGPLKVDHKDRNIFNCKKENLRLATISQNGANQAKTKKPRSSKYKGVSWHKRDKLWRASIQVNGNMIHLGMHMREENAALAYNIAATKYFGEFALLNILEGDNACGR